MEGTLQVCDIEFLSTEEKSSIPKPVFEKVVTHWRQKIEELSNLQIEFEKAQTNSDQSHFQVEKEIVDLQKALKEECTTRENAQSELVLLKEKYGTQNEQLENLTKEINNLQQQLQKSHSELEAATEHCTSITANLESKSKLNEELRDQIKILEGHLDTSRRSKCDALVQIEEANSAKLQVQYKEKRFEQEKSHLSRQIEILKEQLEKRSEEVLLLRKEHSSSLLNLQSDLNHSTEEANTLRRENDALLKENSERKEKIENLLVNLNETRESANRLEESFKKELKSHEKYSDSLKSSNESGQKRIADLEKTAKELNELLQKSSDQYGALESAKLHSEKEAEKTINEKNAFIRDLKEELDKVNEMLKCSSQRDDDYLRELSPAASVASQLMKKGLTLSQLYSEYIRTTDKLLFAEDENKRLTRYVEQILKEIEEKAPILRRQKEDYERALETINTLHAQIDNSIEDLEKQRIEAEGAQRRSNFLGRENDVLNKQVKDLGKQVTVLLTQLEAARAGLPPPSLSFLENISTENRNASDVIDQHLVTFRDVSELQEQNTKLRASLRDLTDKLESAEQTAVETKTQEFKEELEMAHRELNELKSARERMEIVVENITRQRDMYRTLLNEQKTTPSSKSRLSTFNGSSEEYETLKQSLDAARKEAEKLRKEYEEYKYEKKKNEDLEKSEYEKLKSYCEKTRNENIKLLSQAEYNEERLKTLQSSCESYQRQSAALEEKNETLQSIVGRHEGTIESLREHTLSLTKKLSHLEVMTSNLRDEKTLLKESEARLMAERDSLHRSQYSLSLLMSNMEAIKNNLDKNDSETKMRYENKISNLTEQCSRLKAKLETNIDVKEAQTKLNTLEEQLRVSKAEANATKKALNEMEKKYSDLVAQEKVKSSFTSPPVLTRIRSPMQTSPATPKSSTMVSQTVREIQVQLEEEKAKSSSFQTSLTQAQTNIVKLKELVEKQESQIKEFNETTKAAQNEIESLRKSLEKTEHKLKEFEEKLKNADDSEKALKELMDKRLMDLTKDLEERENELEETQKKLEDSKKTEVKAREQQQEQNKITLETQTKYEREIMYHAADLEALKSLKNTLANYNSEKEEVDRARIKAEDELKEIKASQEARIDKLVNMNKEYNTRIEELEDQNKTLLNQFTELSERWSSIQMKLSSGAEGVNSSFSEDEARSSEQLLEIIKYLRREKEIALGKIETKEAEAMRIESQRKSLEEQVKQLNKNLSEEREKNQATRESDGKYAEMMRKVHTLDALTDSNHLLREEKENLKNTLDEVNAKLASLQSQIEPLHGRLHEKETMVDKITAEKKALEEEKENFKKRSQELVEKLNKSRPEDMVKLQQEVNNIQKISQSKDAEINRLKHTLNNLQKNQQGLIANKNRLQQMLQHTSEESKKFSDDNKRLVQEKVKLQGQATSSLEKIQNLEASKVQDQQKSKQLLQQISEFRQREEKNKNEVESLKKTIEGENAKIKELEEKLVLLGSRAEILHKQNIQLRKIANKYKTKVESNPDTAESSGATGEEESEEKKILRQPDQSAKKEEPAKLMDQLTKLKAEIQKKDEELAKLKSQDEGLVAKLQSELEAKNQELQKANSAHVQYKDKVSSELVEMNKTLEEGQSKKVLYESRILTLEKEKDQLLQQIESYNKKLSMQQKILENYQKQTSTVQKLSPTGIIEKPTLDTPPTANIKPMAAPIPTSAVPSPRSQGSSQGSGSSRSIPTASIKPMATTSTPTSQTSPSVVAVSPMEAHSGGDGAVSSTVTIPQATVTRTPVAAASTTTQAFPPSLTATVSPTPVSQSSIVSTAPFVQPNVASVQPRQDEHSDAGVIPTPSGSADSIVSQAIALVAPQIEDRSTGSQKRKLESVLEQEEEEEEELEDAKRTRLLHEESGVEEDDEEDEGMEDDDEDDDDDDEDMGEPSSSSHRDERKIEKEVLVLSSDEENDVPPSQSGREEEDQEENANEGGREAEAEGNEEGEGSSTTPSSSLQPPPRPLHEPPSSSSRQSLAPFHQLPNYEEGGDDRMVPSTPTFVPRPCEGQSGDGVSSPQVPSQGFEFGASSGEGGPDGAAPSSDGLSQIGEGGVSIDATRMDLAQLDDATHSSVPSVPVQSFPTEQSAEGNISSSGDDGGGALEVSQGRSSPLNTLEEAEEQIERSDDVVSSQDDVEPELEIQQPPEEGSQSPLQEQGEEENENRSDDRRDESFSIRETRSTSGASQGRSPRTPITWDSPSGRSAGRTGRGQSERGEALGGPARTPVRGAQRGRRSRGPRAYRGAT